MDTRIVFVDLNPAVVRSLRKAFSGISGVEVRHGSLLDQRTDAWVSPTNSRGRMSGGIDAAVKGRLGPAIENRLRQQIALDYGGFLPIGCATCIPTGRTWPSFLISAPTMSEQTSDVSATHNAALACCAALHAVHQHNRDHRNSIRSVAIPGLGTGTGRVSPELCADLFFTTFHLFLARGPEGFADFSEAGEALTGAVTAFGPIDHDDAWAERAKRLRQGDFAQT